ncbi:myosin regulatory light chain 12B isoform X1 [Octopus sinensis]|uniref:Myosin regulatory light chain 12B isoform X1 n=3 Tax=Octopus TaxID=6643 RepID=A0A7E6F3I7_9MOLL|nr:myosin regulatory light chain 12B isoform X1 [Octopus sinensis]
MSRSLCTPCTHVTNKTRTRISKRSCLKRFWSSCSVIFTLFVFYAPERTSHECNIIALILCKSEAVCLVKMSSRKAKGKTTKKRAQRATSNVFAMFDQAQIQEFKEAFNMIDQNKDGLIDKEDLHDMLASLGKDPDDNYLNDMVNDATGPINFTLFLTMFGDKLNGTDPEDVIKNAFACFDEDGTGVIHEDRLRELLTTMGDRFSDEDVDEIFREAPIKSGNFDYIEFTRILKHGKKDKDDD